MSYNSESLISKEDIVSLLESQEWKNISVKEIDYTRFKSNTRTKQPRNVVEYIFCASK